MTLPPTPVADDMPGEARDGVAAAWVCNALEASMRARAPAVHASTPVVRQLAAKIARTLGLDAEASALLDMSVRVRDVGMVALPDAVVLARASLSPAEWAVIHRHPVLGADLLEGLEVVASAAHVVRAHHECWDGSGYPDGRSADAIPLLSRVIAACDAFVAIARDRPHRRGIGAEAALDQVCQGSGSQFDPGIADALVAALTRKRPARPAAREATARVPAERDAASASGRGGPRDLTGAMAVLDPIPAFAPACDRILAAIDSDRATGGELVAAVESDTGLTVAILRRAQLAATRRPVTNVADAVTALEPAEIARTIRALPRAEFPWRSSRLDVLMHRTRVHAQAVARAADRIVAQTKPSLRDDVLAVALLHDVGKLALGHAHPDHDAVLDARATPEQRVRHEQRTLGMDHASVGGLLLSKWGLHRSLASAVTSHHSAEAEHEVATYVRLADMVAHYAQAERTDRSKMLQLAQTCGLSSNALRDVLFDLPHAGGSQKRRAEPSPLSERETAVLRSLARGNVYKLIAVELGVSTSTVRTHLHNIYTKLGVEDRAQAVLRATEMGWL